MPSNAQVAAKLMRDAAGFFIEIAQQNPSIGKVMEQNAKTFITIAELVEQDPGGECVYLDPIDLGMEGEEE